MTNGAADFLLFFVGLAAVFVGVLVAMGAAITYLTRHVEDIPSDADSQPADTLWFDKEG